jgi:hypothetical protein
MNYPPFLSHLIFGKFFDKPVDYLPPYLTHLSLGSFFSKPINNLPASLLYLSISDRYPLKKYKKNISHIATIELTRTTAHLGTKQQTIHF